VWNEARESVRTLKQNTDQYVRKNPAKAVFTALAIGFVFGLTSEVPNFTGENLAEIFAFADDGILEDLELVVGDEVVAECGGVEGDGEEDEDGEMEEAGAARFGATAGRESGGGRSGDGSGLGRLGRVFAFSGQGFGLNLQILVTE